MGKKPSNDSMAQQKAKKQNEENKNQTKFGNRHMDGPNHPST
ncbi:hypothetical protein SAMN04488502_101624 [Dendrosporobacter quercicolus]|uniref:Uncharacterized protein n=1 Tax=Dendrosporobacter quercicolus TaxID=146817 RepID=A0A1G9MAA6_9FIRM|nr:hypothetical protein [Dendrosporobacter quercicolus]SDL71054.1 hypothetical protein SAMN04488502_101624 [Dendrosporobacter quercicolus]